MKSKKGLIGLGVLVLAAAALILVYRVFAPKPVAGEKTVTLKIVHGDQTTKTVELHTSAEYLGEALDEEEGLVDGEEGPYGLYIKTVDGETASDADRTWWCITKAGAELPTSADLTPIADGDRYELTLMDY